MLNYRQNVMLNYRQNVMLNYRQNVMLNYRQNGRNPLEKPLLLYCYYYTRPKQVCQGLTGG